MNANWELVNPEGAARPSAVRPAPRPRELKRIGLAWNGKPGGEAALSEIADLLAERQPDLEFIKYWEVLPDSVAPRELSPPTLQAMAARQPDLVIVSQAD